MKIKPIIITICILIILIGLYLIFSQTSTEKTNHKTTIEFTIEWEKTIGGNNADEGWYVLPTNDQGCILTGYTKSYGTGNQDLWLIKMDKNGEEEWIEIFKADGDEKGKNIQQTKDGGYLIIGTKTTTSQPGVKNKDIWLIKVDENGKEQWNTTFGGPEDDEGYSIDTTKDGGFILSGVTLSYGAGERDAWLIKINETGVEQWNKTYGGNEYDEGKSVIETSDNGFAIAGRTKSYGSGETDAWLIKTDESGVEQWNKTFGSNNYDNFNQIIQADDGGFIITGHTQVTAPYEWYGFIVKTDNNGVKQWETKVKSINITGTSSIDTIDNGYFAVGYIGEYGDSQDLLMLKLDLSGKITETHTVQREYCNAAIWAQKTSNNKFFITGYNDVRGTGFNDLWVLKIKLE